ncbi:4'-phosphopantetheinyl transferase family protein [Sulfitobacter sabulilitoris]|nr:4'-phosphopantetheinyl transferase superfamily protein [Sulfitobacter sabulilitoris]
MDPDAEALMLDMARGVFSRRCAVAMTDPRSEYPGLWPDESLAIATARPKRRREFAAGRAAVRRAMRALDLPAAAVPQGHDRAPVWPPGTTGSISHCDMACIAVLALVGDAVSLGVDIEPDTPLEPELWPAICTPPERDRLSALPVAQRGRMAKLLFCIKEAAYKCQYPLSREIIDFDRLEVTPDLVGGTFAARFTAPTGPFGKDHVLGGRFARGGGLILAGMILPPGADRGAMANGGSPWRP